MQPSHQRACHALAPCLQQCAARACSMADEVVLPDEPAQAQPSQRITPYLAKSSAARRHTPASSGKFKERMQSGAVQAVLNAHVEAAGGEPMDVEGTRCEVQVLGAPLHPGARFMVDRLEDKVGRGTYAWGQCSAAVQPARSRAASPPPQCVRTHRQHTWSAASWRSARRSRQAPTTKGLCTLLRWQPKTRPCLLAASAATPRRGA